MTKNEDLRVPSWEEKTAEAAKKAVDGGLEEAVGWAGGVLTGFSIRMGEEETLMTLRVVLAGRKQIAFVASGTLAQCLAKAVREAKSDKLRFKPDRYAEKKG